MCYFETKLKKGIHKRKRPCYNRLVLISYQEKLGSYSPDSTLLFMKKIGKRITMRWKVGTQIRISNPCVTSSKNKLLKRGQNKSKELKRNNSKGGKCELAPFNFMEKCEKCCQKNIEKCKLLYFFKCLVKRISICSFLKLLIYNMCVNLCGANIFMA